MGAAAPPAGRALIDLLRRLGREVRARRKRLRVSATVTAETAGMSRQTLYRIEKGEPSVAIGAWLAAAGALGLELALVDPQRKGPARRPPSAIRVGDFPQLRKLAWQLRRDTELSPKEALDLYERNWRHVDAERLEDRERELIDQLAAALGRERLLV